MLTNNGKVIKWETLDKKEKIYGNRLIIIGKIACFLEYFDNIVIDDDTITRKIPVDNPRETISFNSGYYRAKALIDNGFSRENYNDLMMRLNDDVKELIEDITAKKRHR